MTNDPKIEDLRELEAISEEIAPPATIFSRLPNSLSALKHHNFRLFWFGQLLSLCGTWMQSVAQGWLVLMLTNSAFLLGTISAIAALPILVLSLFGGILADHVDKRKLIILTQILSMLCALSLGVLISLNEARFWNIALIVGSLGLVNAFDVPARQAFVIELVGKKDLTNAIALNSSAFNIARIIGPVIAGFIIGGIGMASCFYINAVSFIAVIVGLLFMKDNFRPKAQSEGSVLSKLKSGARYVIGNKEILYLIIMVGVISIFGMSNVILMPIFARDILNIGSKGLGLLMAGLGFGSLAGAVTLALFNHYKKRNLFITLGGVAMGVSLVFFSLSKIYELSIMLLGVFGWGMVVQLASINNILQSDSPDNLRGRVMSFYTLMFLGMAPIGSIQSGFLAHLLGAPVTVMLGGMVCLLAVVIIGLIRRRGKVI